MSASIHDKLKRAGKLRVHIEYEVQTEAAQIQRELPFVMGVLGAPPPFVTWPTASGSL